ncbi:YbaB/EbfC family nucleoid-associated protein [Streptomyces sp. NBC_00631]|uniref:YbaB/EbfC family nucleoid-associated protein n=1 Tax=Streptomyces sp. NBC_00631 TaxID=2975793 RepID=UPI0030E1248A
MPLESDDDIRWYLDTDLAELSARAQRAAEAVAGHSVTQVAPDRSVTVTVGPGGNLIDIAFGRNAGAMSPQRLATLVMKLVDEATQRASGDVRAAFADLVGENQTAMDVLAPFIGPTDDSPSSGLNPKTVAPGFRTVVPRRP